MSADLQQAHTFLDALAPGEPVTFQTFDDRPGKRPELARILHGTLSQHAGTLAHLNSRGAGIYVMVNEGDGKGRTKENVVRVRVIVCDFDGVPLPEHWALRPHILVLSSPGKGHVYWLVCDLPLEEFSVVQKVLAALYGSDSSVSDKPRVMRLPGYYHCKHEPVMVRLLETAVHPAYRRTDLLTAWPTIAHALKPRPQRTLTTPKATADASRMRRYALAALQNEHDNVANAQEGQRNVTLNRAAYSLGQLAGGLERHEVEEALAGAALRCGLSEGEALRTIKSGFEAGLKEPRILPAKRFDEQPCSSNQSPWVTHKTDLMNTSTRAPGWVKTNPWAVDCAG